jgi:hypothetical protein
VSRHNKTSKLIEMATETLRQHHPMSVRQVYYRLVSQQVIENTRSSYQSVSKTLVAARREGLIPWCQIEDRLRKPRSASRGRRRSLRADNDHLFAGADLRPAIVAAQRGAERCDRVPDAVR